jgi:hypothetical protein
VLFNEQKGQEFIFTPTATPHGEPARTCFHGLNGATGHVSYRVRHQSPRLQHDSPRPPGPPDCPQRKALDALLDMAASVWRAPHRPSIAQQATSKIARPPRAIY